MWKKRRSITGLFAMLGVLIILFTNSLTMALIGILIIGFGFANVFPLIFSITIDHMPEHQNELSGLLVTMVVGGTFIPMIMGVVADTSTIILAFLVPLACLGYITYLGIMNFTRKIE